MTAESAESLVGSVRQHNDRAPRRENTLRLADGRTLGYAEYGDPRGQPVFYFHGFPGSRLEAALADEAASRANARIFAFDRPGYGLSDAKPGRTILDWVKDVANAADELGFARFAVLGVSGGGPYALACAHAIPQRLTATGVVCGLGPTEDPGLRSAMSWPLRGGFLLGRRAPWLFAFMYAALIAILPRWHPEYALWLLSLSDPNPDREAIGRPELKQALLASIREALRRGASGVTQDVRLYARPWGFALESISATVDLWHGEADTTVPVVMGRHVASRLPHCRARFLPEEGHFSLPLNHAAEILRTLVEAQ